MPKTGMSKIPTIFSFIKHLDLSWCYIVIRFIVIGGLRIKIRPADWYRISSNRYI